jgi:hypothetical protein
MGEQEVEMDAVATMGGLLPDDAWGRDAVHVAVFSAYSTEHLYSGQKVGIVNEDGGKDVRVSRTGNSVGIVDPFLDSGVEPGERFWVYLYPRTITGLSHRWTHPAFEPQSEETQIYVPPATKLDSVAWLRDFCQTSDCPDFDYLVEVSNKIADGKTQEWSPDESGEYPEYYGWSYDDDYLHFGGQDAHSAIPPEFWTHMENVIGRQIFKGAKPTYFSCSC